MQEPYVSHSYFKKKKKYNSHSQLLPCEFLDPQGSDPPCLSAKKVSENLKKVPCIWEVECPGGPR